MEKFLQLMQADQANLARIGHLQFADAPGRGEPGTGEINFSFVFETLDRIGYDGWVGAEYRPSTATETTLAWLEAYRAPPSRRGRAAR